MSRHRFDSLPVIVGAGLLVAGGYYAKTRFLDPAPPSAMAGAPVPSETPEVSPVSSNTLSDRPSFGSESDANAKARRDLLIRIGLVRSLSSDQKAKLTTSVERARAVGCIFIIPFEAGRKTLGTRESDLLVKAFQSASVGKLREDPSLEFVVVGYDPQQNEAAALDRAQSVVDVMRKRAGVRNVMCALGAGGPSLFTQTLLAKNQLAEVWAFYP